MSERTSYHNPVYSESFPDPFVLRVGGDYFAYATNGPLGNVQLLASTDLVSWTALGDAMPTLAPWVRPGKTWAPEVVQIGDRFVMYYTADGGERQCLGIAVADDPRGPYVDVADAPFVAQLDDGGSIDASPFLDDDGSRYLYWKNDGNAIGVDTYIYAQRLAPDGLSLVGEVVPLFKQDAPWEGNLVEGPVMWRHGDDYVLFYSGNGFASPAYAVGYALCSSPLGPAVKAAENPILTSAGLAVGPGHCNLIRVGDEDWMLYHAWHDGHVGTDPGRTMWLDRVDWDGRRPIVNGPSMTSTGPARLY